MAIDFATLEIKAKFSDIDGATRALEKLRVTGQQAEQATGNFAKATESAGVRTVAATRNMGAWNALQAEATGHVGEHSLALGRLGYRMESAASEAIGLNSAMGLLGGSFLKFGVGDVYSIAILGGIYALSKAWEMLTDDSKKAREESDKLTKSLVDQAHAIYAATRAGAQAIVWGEEQKLAEKQQQSGFGIGSVISSIIAGHPVMSAGDATSRAEGLAAQTEAVKQAYANLGKIVEEDAKKADEAAKKGDEAFQKRIEILAKGMVFEDQRKRVTAELIGIEHQLEAQVHNGTLSLEKRTVALERLSIVMDALSHKYIVDPHIRNAGQLIGITGDGETGAARFGQTYGGPMANVKAGPTNLIDQQSKDYLASEAYSLGKRLEALLKPFDAVTEAAVQLAEGLKRSRENLSTTLQKFKPGNIGSGIMGGAMEGVNDALSQFTPGALAYSAVTSGINYIVSGFADMAMSMLDGGAAAREYARAQRQANDELKAAIAQYGHDDFAAALANNAAQFEQLMKQVSDNILTVSNVIKNGAQSTRDQYNQTADEVKAAKEKNDRMIAEQQQYSLEDLKVRNMRALGLGPQADLQAFKNQQERELQAAIDANRDAIYISTLKMTENNELLAFLNGTLSDAVRNNPTGFYGSAAYLGQFAHGTTGPGIDDGIIRPSHQTLSGQSGGSSNPAPPRQPINIALNIDGKVMTRVVVNNIDQHGLATGGTGSSRSDALNTYPA